MKNVNGRMPLNASVDAKGAKKEYQGRRESKEVSSDFPLRPWLFSLAIIASTLAFNSVAPIRPPAQARLS
jgi:hypothetical protein